MTNDEHNPTGDDFSQKDQNHPIQIIEHVAPKGWRLKLAKAAAQLIAGSEKGAVAYGEIRDRLDTLEGKSIVSKGLAEAVLHQAVNDPDVMERAKARFLGSALQKQQNLEAVIVGAAQPPLALPAPNGPRPEGEANTEEQIDDDAPKDSSNVTDQPLDQDWAASFTGFAENANSEELRSRLSKILAGELSSPGSYSRSTVRQIVELNRTDLEAMRSVAEYIVGDSIVKLDYAGEQRPTVGALLPLEEAGLITGASSFLQKTCSPAADDGVEVWFIGHSRALRITLKKGHAFSLPIAPLTKTGIAVADLLGRTDETKTLLRLADILEPASYSKVEIGKLTSPKDVALPLQQIKPDPIAHTISTFGIDPFSTPIAP